ncbi:hypothetical protein HPP92_028755 [Vanilla planifolia]|uniref:J domain-containing protein n=1 Tax=Vanilla planifolia TaxID=51239 RepID=A0A835P6I4_VANPL|nr:hypothetical protein HPP92_028755 [Vanilla planifolia]
MDCNRGEALRAKELAERKFSEKDYIGAMKFAMKAQNLFPSLEGVSQLITTLDVYLASEGKVNGEKDWYAVLHVSASADEETVKKQYRKLALLLHPDKNKSAGAEGAFQIVSEAWSVLSDKSKKMVYDQKICVEGFQQTASQSSKNTSVPCATTNGSYQFYSDAAEKTKKQQRNSHKPQSAPPPSHSTLPTFWTSCAGCCMQYEYHRVYLNKSLLCPKCKKPFLATELASPPTGLNPTRWSFKQQKQQIKHKNSNSLRDTGAAGLHQGQSANSLSNSNFQWAANVSHQTHENVKRQREEAEAAVRREETLHEEVIRAACLQFCK